MIRLPDFDPNELDDIMSVHAAEIGRVAIAWNGLQEVLGQLLWAIAFPEDKSLCFAIWNSVRSDRDQREVLMSAAAVSLPEDSRLLADIKWACGKAQALEDDRNTTLHSPYEIFIENGTFKFSPSTFFGNRRAQKLANKNLSVEFESYEHRAKLLMNFVRALFVCAAKPDDSSTWPQRPELRRAVQTTNRKKSRRQKDGK